MRSIVLTLALAAAGPQVSAKETFRIGAVGDLDIVRPALRPQPAGTTMGSRKTWGAGLVLQWPLGERASLAVEPSLLHKGGVLRAPVESLSVTTRQRYLELPVRLRRDLASGAVQPYLVAGASLGYLHGAKARVVAPGLDEELDTRKAVRSLDFGATLGAGLALGEGGLRIFVEGLYTRGFANLAKTEEATVRNRSIQVRLGLLFGSGRRAR